jgi:hypothetical protein
MRSDRRVSASVAPDVTLWRHAVTPDGSSTTGTPIDVALGEGERVRVEVAEGRLVIPTGGEALTLTLSMSSTT